jgi:chromosomal replication initiator protein
VQRDDSLGHERLDASLLWQAVLADLQQSVTATAFEWLRHTELGAFEDDRVTIEAADRVTADTLNRRFTAEIERAISLRIGRPASVSFRAKAGTPSLGPMFDPSPQNGELETARLGERNPMRRGALSERSKPAQNEKPTQMPLAPARSAGLHPRYVFRTYVVGSSNRFAHAASVSVAEHPGGKYNPLFLHGGVGLGKTHLLHATGHRSMELNGNLQVAYVTSEKFTNDLIAAIRQQRTDDFRARYREIDILMIDDIQFIAGKESTQEEFFHTFNALYQSGKQVIISSDKPPKAISALEERLRSRFEGGLIADVQLPDYEMRMAILRLKGEELGLGLPSDVTEYIAQKDQKNIRELEGALNKVIARAQLTSEPLTLALAIEALTDSASNGHRVRVSREDIIVAVERHFSVGRRELTGRKRTKEVVLPRQIAMYLLRADTDASLIEIGADLGGRDHTTVLHGIRQIERQLTSDAGLRSRVFAIRESLAGVAG